MTEAPTPDAVTPLHAELRRLMPGIPEADVVRFAAAITAPEPYAPGPDARPREGVPRGELTELRHVGRSVYPGVERTVRVYRPAAIHAGRPLCLAVFQDGARYLGPEAQAAVVLDNLIAAGELPPTLGLFVEPGESGPGLPVYGGIGNRSVEYDSLGDAYARFLIEELVPAATAGIALSEDRSAHVICGLSSGGICAFNAAWERPDYFGKVVSHCGSFVDIRGGHALAADVRRSPSRDLRVFLQTGVHDLDILFGAWTLANRELASALAYRGYEHRLAVGEGGHSLAHGGSILADTLRWLWRNHGPRTASV